MSSSDLHADASVVAAIKQSVPPQVVSMGNADYFDRPLHLPPNEREISPLRTHTLQSIVDFLEGGGESDWAQSAIVHVVSSKVVQLVSPLFGRNNQRHTYLIADCSDFTRIKFRFDQYLEPEAFIVGLLSEFVDTPARAEVLQLVGNLKSENVTEANDDGFSQSVTVRKGVSRVQEISAPSIVTLAPYRTFRNIPQPESRFLLRFREGNNKMPNIALFEADGEGWKNDAIAQIDEWLARELTMRNLENKIIA
jgi:hypothetical protein